MTDHTARLNQFAALLSIVTYLILSVSKLWLGYLFQSEALSADGLNNSTDTLASVVVLIGLRLSLKPPDSDHPYGHRRVETVSSMIASFIMFVVGWEVLFHAGKNMYQTSYHKPSPIGAIVALFSAVVMFVIYQVNMRIAKQTKSQAVKAAAKDNLSDSLVSIGTMIGIIAAQLQMPWLDSLTACIIGCLIMKTAWDIFQEASHSLSDGIDAELLKLVEQELLEIKGLSQISSIKGRVHGNHLLLDLDILVDPDLTVYESHLITEQIEERLKQSFQISHVQIHVEPEPSNHTFLKHSK